MSLAPESRGWPILLALSWTVLPLFWHLPPWLPALALLAFAARAWLAFQHAAMPGRKLLLPALLLGGVGLWLSLGVLVGREGGVALLVLLIAFKGFETASLRDWRVLLALGFFLAAMPLLFDQSPLMAVWLAVCVLLLTWAAAVLAGSPPRGSLRNALQALALSLPLMLILFVFMPRLPEPLWSMPGKDNVASSGLGDDMEPGSIGRMILNRDPAFSVVFAGEAPRQDQLYWRVLLLDDFDGRRWLSVGGHWAEKATMAGGRPLRYSLTLRADKGRVPVLDVPSVAAADTHLEAGALLRQDRKHDELSRYQPISLVGGHYLVQLGREEAFYLRLPPGNPRSRELARQLAMRSGGGARLVAEILQFLRLGGFRYTLQPPVLGDQQIDQFLFSTRQGFCEHYASAFVFLARAGGLPARVVAGYQGGEFNPLGQFWLVRSSDAHAWAEIWLDGRWLRVDPTAAVSPDRVEQGADQALPALRAEGVAGMALPPVWLRGLRNRWQAANFAWQQWVVGYDADRQKGLFRRLKLGDRVDGGSVLRGLLAGLLLSSLPILFWWRGRTRVEPLTQGWRALRNTLQKRGVIASPSMGPVEVLKAARGLPKDDYRRLQALIREYIELRYRCAEANPGKARDWMRRARRWK
ncbi:DUF3488 and transglutaminase-like domain-containing protein [Chromobacterium sp. IIBBL 290-4]|uniref:transglutaminase family protein n=1 Tax=Chromobacterium sp. IIBBL 290-4 TaxID=2953890 RepID=UPI0020B8644B|nr:DUF3488 and transglutaminase-like domain-containing protein [Chromobacterium sp. IIBBL 290-4]UTH72411.1 DUF3488 and transglutaminase-like domain-containing protein [Chromobacterium sp. IIBBL 290-4]